MKRYKSNDHLTPKDVIIEKEKICTLANASCLLDHSLPFPSLSSFSLFYPVILSSSLILSLFFCPGSKAASRPGGIGSAAAGQPGIEGDSMLSKILPGGAAEQAGKLGEGTRNTSLCSTL